MPSSIPQIKLYTHPMSPWSHRVSIALDELKLPYETEIVDIQAPRTPEYLAINPRGLIPALSYDGKILIESTVITTFLADTYSTTSSLLPASNDPEGPLTRAKISLFVETYFSKVVPTFMKAQKLQGEARSAALSEYVDAVAKELEPLLADAAPYFAGSDGLTLAEVLTGPFIVRAYVLPKHDIYPASLLTDLASKAPNFHRWAETMMANPTVNGGIFDENKVAGMMKKRMGGGA